MKNYLAKMNPSHKGVGSSVMRGIEYSGAGYLFGFVQNKYREKASIRGVPADVLVGMGLKAVSLACAWKGKEDGFVGTQSEIFGNAGLTSFFHTLGAGHGAHSAGVYRLLLTSEADKAAAKRALPNATILGEIPKAPHGDFLSSSQLQDMAR